MNKVEHTLKPVETERVLVLSRAAYMKDPTTGTLRRIGKPLNKHERRKAGVKKCAKL